MGMSAGQARLLSITRRLTNNEFRAQTITNSKLRLADKSTEASQEYMDALTSQKLMYGAYTDNGDRTFTSLTPNTIFSYGDLKNQYSIVDASGKVLMNGADIKKFENSNTLKEYLSNYGIGTVTVENNDYTETLQTILGPNWQNALNDEKLDYTNVDETKSFLLDGVGLENQEGILNGLNNAAAAISGIGYSNIKDQSGYDNFMSQVMGNLAGCSFASEVDGAIGRYYDTLANPPKWIGDEPVKPPVKDFGSLANAYNNQRCHGAVESASSAIESVCHIEHNLAALIWGENGLKTSNSDGILELKNSKGTITITVPEYDLNNVWPEHCDKNVSLTNSDVISIPQSVDLLNAIRENLNYGCIAELKTDLIDLYCDTINYINKNGRDGWKIVEKRDDEGQNVKIANITSTTSEIKTDAELREGWKKFYNDLASAQGKIEAIVLADYNKQKAQWDADLTKFQNDMQSWKNSFGSFAQAVEDAIALLGEPTKEVSDETDARYQWYVNLWYRMGAIDEDNKGAKTYKELDENLINNENWLQFALEHGIVSLEQAKFDERGSNKYPHMGTYDWQSIIYTNATDIVAQDDEVAIALAEVKYKNKTTEIQNEDKKFDQELKKLDTEHNALQTEYESVKEVISKNVDRSFKAFS